MGLHFLDYDLILRGTVTPGELSGLLAEDNSCTSDGSDTNLANAEVDLWALMRLPPKARELTHACA